MTYKIVHYLFRDVFTSGYINFMVNEMKEYQHIFIMKTKPKVFKHGIKSNKADMVQVDSSAKIILIDEDREIIDSDRVKNEISSCNKLIISGIFDNLSYFLKYPDSIWRKTYLHFWGGDFYCFREDSMRGGDNKRKKDKQNVLEAIQRCKAVLNVLDTDYEMLSDILQVDKEHMEAPMPEQLGRSIDYEKYTYDEKTHTKIKIVMGNSAASDNCHIEMFNRLSWLAHVECEIVCPLSYGEVEYRDVVMAEGRRIFGKKITFLTEYIELDAYIKLLSSCDIGIYNNNRQQGFKNITTMLALGKKVFLRENTATWNKLNSLGIKVFSIEDITGADIGCFEKLDNTVSEKNNLYIKTFIESYKGRWEYILNDKSHKIMIERLNKPIGLNIHLTDHCNLKCKGCSHFAPIADEYYISKEALEITLSNVFSNVKTVFNELCLMGGEPLLHPKLVELLNTSRRYCPNIPITLVTNGLLLISQDESIWEACRKNDVIIQITCYPIPCDYEAIIEYVKKQNVKVKIYVDRRDGKFRKDTLEISGSNQPVYNYAKCRIGGLYPQIRDFKLYRCATAANINILNKKFRTEFKHDKRDFLTLTEMIDDECVRDFLFSASPFCRYCNLEKQQFMKWDFSKKEKEEWL